jgi:competence protein ComEC
MEFRLGANAQLRVLAPGRKLVNGTKADANNNSVVVRLLFGRVRMLFPGDIEKEGEGRLIASHQDLESQVLKVAHHGGLDSTSLEFLRLVRPEYLILSVGAGNKSGCPDRNTLQRLSKDRTSASLFRTDNNGTITVRTDGRRIVVETQR